MIEFIWTVSVVAFLNLYQAAPTGLAILDPQENGGNENGYSRVRLGETDEGQAERVKEGENFPETGTWQDAVERPFRSREGQAYEKTTDKEVEEALTKDGDFSVYQEAAGDEIITKSDALEVQADLTEEKKFFSPIAKKDSDMKKKDDSAVYNDRKGDKKNNQTALMSNKDYNKTFRDVYGKPRDDNMGDTAYQIDETLDKQQAGAKQNVQISNYTKPSSNKLDPAIDKTLIGDPIQQS